MAGTFVITTPISVGTKTVSESADLFNLGTTNADLIAGLTILGHALALGNVTGGPTINGVIRYEFNLTDNIISLDGSPAISFNSLPSGFTPTSLTLSVDSTGSDFTDPDTLFLQFNTFIESSGFVITNTGPTPSSFIRSFSFPAPSMLDIMSDGVGFRCAFFDAIHSIRLFNFSLSGDYIIQSSSFTPTITNTTPIYPGQIVTINTLGGAVAGSQLTGVIRIQLSYPGHLIELVLNFDNPYLIIDGIIYYWLDFVFIQTPYTLQFYLPFGFKRYTGSVTVTLVGNGTQFVGSVVAGTIQVLYADASGIYTLDSTQTNDKLYFRSGYITVLKQIMLDFENTLESDDYFSIKQEKFRVLAQNEEDEEQDLFMDIAKLIIPSVSRDTAIPSPFVKTAFLP